MMRTGWQTLGRVGQAIAWFGGLVIAGATGQAGATGFYVVQAGQARGAIVVDAQADPIVRRAAEELQWHLQRATQVTLPLVTPAEAEQLDQGTALLVVGPNALTERLGVSAGALPPEAFRLRTVGRHLVFLGQNHRMPVMSQSVASVSPADHPRSFARETTRPERGAKSVSPATVWAVNAFLDHHVGVRWLWPGEAGTYVPRLHSLPLPEIDVLHRPALAQRGMDIFLYRRGESRLLDARQYEQLWDDAQLWLSRYQMGTRSEARFGHAFSHWWERYHAEHPDLFATPPAGFSQPYPRPDRVKLCLSNPKVIETILAEWQAAGAPDHWNVCPNDGSGFCVCDGCRAMDEPAEQEVVAIWRAQGALTVRYVRFWNQLLGRMRLINPQATLQTYAYSAYRNPPPAGLKLVDGLVLQIVDGYNAQARASWQHWQAAGARLFLRPNWFHTGGVAPHLPLGEMSRFLTRAREQGLEGVRFDALMGHWATQGPAYYLMARMIARPDLSADAVLAEYAQAFEEAAPAIADYLQYWERFTEKVEHRVPGTTPQNVQGIYETLVREKHLSPYPLVNTWQVIPYLYTDAVLDQAAALLDQADTHLPADRTEARARVQFLRDGLEHLRRTRDVIVLGTRELRLAGTVQADWERAVEELQALRRQLTPRHVVWGEFLNATEERMNIRTAPGRGEWTEADGDGV